MWLTLLLFVSAAAIVVSETCPAYPNPRNVDPEALFSSPEVKSALDQINELFSKAAKTIPSGFIATIVFDQTTMFTKGYGFNDISNKQEGPPTKHSLVRIASITKVFTTMLLYRLRDANLITLEDKLTSLFPKFSMERAKAITLRELASHTSGLPRELPYPCCAFTIQNVAKNSEGIRYPNSVCNETTILEILKTKPIVSGTHRRFHYSNLGMALLGRALAHVSTERKMTYEEMVLYYITNPLNMVNATFNYNDTTKTRSAKGVSMNGKKVVIPYEKTCGFGAPAGCLWASAEDMELLMKFLFRIDPLPSKSSTSNGDPLSSDTIAEMLAPSILLRNGYEAVGTPFEMQYISNKYWTKGKQGELPGYRSSLTFIEDLKLGIFTSALISDVESNSVWTIDALNILTPAIDKALRRLEPKPSLPDNYAMYVGKYYDGSVTVEINDNNQLIFNSSAGSLNLIDLVPPLKYALRVQNMNEMGCRWLDDGTNNEIVSFIVENSTAVVAMEFMGSRYNKFL
jgi:CubicO group peptidase (beta-lactamase class C family)